MNWVEQNLANWKSSLLQSMPLAGLISRDSVVYKWKAPFRCWILREVLFWRTYDLCEQSYVLHQQGHGLGARILLRSAFETLAVLIYLNQSIQNVIDGKLSFYDFGKKTSALLLGSKDKSTSHTALNIMTILEKSDKSYPGLGGLYALLSESAHPNYEGMLAGYTKTDQVERETFFSNRWIEKYGPRHLDLMETCMGTFHFEYDHVWADLMYKLESWIVTNDDQLEAAKNERFDP